MDLGVAAAWDVARSEELSRTRAVWAAMRMHALVALLTFAGVLSCPPPSAHAQGVNARVGDASWVATYGREPAPDDSEADRIQTHLLWVVDRLSAVPAAGLSHSARERRLRLLESLRVYARARRFPRVDRVQRTPRFVDDRGVLCAVGHLISESGHPALVEAVRRDHEYDLIEEMHEPALERWAARHGFDLNELALIQPAYRSERPPDPAPVRVDVRVSGVSEELEPVLQRAIRMRTAALRACYERSYSVGRPTDPPRAARVPIHARLGSEGVIADVESPRSEDPFVACLTRRLRSTRVPPPETPDLPLDIVVAFGSTGELPTLDRAALMRLLEEERAAIEACVRDDDAATSVSVRVVVRAAGRPVLQSRSEPRSPSAQTCVDGALQRVAQRATLEFRVEATTRARARWRVASRAARRRALGSGSPSDALGPGRTE